MPTGLSFESVQLDDLYTIKEFGNDVDQSEDAVHNHP